MTICREEASLYPEAEISNGLVILDANDWLVYSPLSRHPFSGTLKQHTHCIPYLTGLVKSSVFTFAISSPTTFGT